VVDGNDAVSISQLPHDVSPSKRPRWIPMNAQDRFASPLVDVMNFLAIDFDKMGLERVFIRKAVFSSKLVSSSHIPLSKVQSLLQSNSAGYNF
jgi:hypothetical protein